MYFKSNLAAPTPLLRIIIEIYISSHFFNVFLRVFQFEAPFHITISILLEIRSRLIIKINCLVQQGTYSSFLWFMSEKE